jgi:hypothetical protein
MRVEFDIKNPPKRKIPIGRVGRDHHYVMIFPEDFIGIWGKGFILKGKPYINFFDSFLEDCHKRVFQMGFKSAEHTDFLNAYSACLN